VPDVPYNPGPVPVHHNPDPGPVHYNPNPGPVHYNPDPGPVHYNPGPGPGPLPPSAPIDHLPHDATAGTRHLEAAYPLDLRPFNLPLPQIITLEKRGLLAEEDLSIPNYLPNGSTRGTHHTGATSANGTSTLEYFQVSHLDLRPLRVFAVPLLREIMPWGYSLLIFGSSILFFCYYSNPIKYCLSYTIRT